MNGKKIIKISFYMALLIMPIIAFTFNKTPAKAKTCSKTITYYFIKGIYMGNQEDGVATAVDKTTFNAPKEWGNNFSVSSVELSYNWSETDTKNYFSNQKISNCTTGASTAWCDPTDTQCLNSGNGQDYVWEDCDLISLGGSDSVSIGGVSANDFADKYFIGANESGTEVNFVTNGNEIEVKVDRNWDQMATDSSGEYYDGKWMFQPLKADVTYDGIPCDEEEEEEQDQDTCAVSNGSTITASGCNNYHYSSTYNKAYSTKFSSSQSIPNSCNNNAVLISGSGVITFTENGTLNVGVNPREQYAGGGFSFNLGYNGSASKKFCKKPGQKDEVTCSCTTKTWQPDGCEIGSDGKCKTDANGNAIIRYSCMDTGCACTEADIQRVKSDIEAQAEQEFGSPTSKPTVLSRDSNNEKDTQLKNDIGTASAGGGGTSSWVKFTQSHACIELREKTVNGVTYPAYVSYNKNGANCIEAQPNGYSGQKDGEFKYYIPLKYPDGQNFPVKADSHGKINVLKGNNWSFNLTCNVITKQKIYDDKGYKFIYRPIDMSNPFPKTVNQNREIGSNWVAFMKDEKAKENKLNRSSNGLEYYASLDENSIRSIKAYNDSQKTYFGLNTINNSGKSNLLLDNGVLNMVEKKANVTINKLGECTEECW